VGDSLALIKLARSNPSDERTARLLFLDYEATKDHDQSYDLTYLQLKWFYEQDKWRYLNAIGKLWMDGGKNSIAFMCFIGSLAINPNQPIIFELAQSLSDHSRLRIANNLRGNKFTVSVIMPTYNRVAEIKGSIQSVLDQSFKDFELVIVNDGGTDAVKEVVDSFGSKKIKYYKLERNKGLSGALNEGILKAEGKYIAYLDDDDVFYSNHLSNLVAFIDRHPDYDYVYSNAWWCEGETKGGVYVEISRRLLERRPKRFSRQLLFNNNYISTLNILHRKDCFTKAGFFNEDLGMLMDWELWIRFAHEYNFCQLNDITGEYRFKRNNMSTVDQLSVVFLAHMIRRFYEMFYGKIIFLKQYLSSDQKKKAEEVYYDILSNCSKCTLAAKKELFYISKKFPRWKNTDLYMNLATEYLNRKVESLFGSS
jgi:glycosyltransferase involved in cell wall biosynthesis